MAPGRASAACRGGQHADRTPKTSGNQMATPTGHPTGENFTIHSVDGRYQPWPTRTPTQNRCLHVRSASSNAHRPTPRKASGHHPHGGMAAQLRRPARTASPRRAQRPVGREGVKCTAVSIARRSGTDRQPASDSRTRSAAAAARASRMHAGMPTPRCAMPQMARSGASAIKAVSSEAMRSRWPTAYCGNPSR